MNLIARRMRGMQDVLPGEIEKWEFVEKVMKDQAALYGFKTIRTPVLEQTELFERSAGETTDVVEKEMYTFEDKGGRSVSLRPEGTAGVIRAVLENGMHNWALPLKLTYISSCYRYERPQTGRFREFFQFGLEIIGGNATMADVELICLADSIFKRLGMKNVRVSVNAIGCEGCRGKYVEDVKEYLNRNRDELCPTCRTRVEKNPLRAFDCKNEKCKEILQKAPLAVGYICKDCAEHFQRLKDYVYASGVHIDVDPFLFRGLDYYTKTVFEFIADCGGTPLAICGGGRYDNLSKIIGGPRITSVGLGIGIERLLSAMDAQGIKAPEPEGCKLYIAPLGSPAKLMAASLASKLRKASIKTELDLVGRFIKPQMKYADKIKAEYVVVIGTNEIESEKAAVKNMKTGEEFEVHLNEGFVEEFIEKSGKNEDLKDESAGGGNDYVKR